MYLPQPIRCYLCHLPAAPQGRTRPVSVTGSPISSATTCPPNLLFTSVDIIYVSTAGARPVVYEFTRKKSGLSQRSWLQSLMKGWIFSSIFHISPFGPLPYEGGSMMIASYLLPRLISLSTNFTQSSTIHLIGASASPDDAAFSFAQVTIPLDASTWVTAAPALAAAHVAPLCMRTGSTP